MTKYRVKPFIGMVALAAACARNEPLREPANGLNESPSLQAGTRTAGQNVTPALEAVHSEQAGAYETPNTSSAVAATQTDVAPKPRTPDVVYVPTPQRVVDKMLMLAAIKKSDVVYDLGCGDGRIVVTAAKRYGVKAYGFDIDPDRVAEARENVTNNHVENLVTIEQRDIFTIDLSPANVVTLYLLPELNVKLIPQLERLKPGSRIVSHDFDMAGVKPVKHLTMTLPNDENSHDVYLWRTPLKKE
jgi:SAM-dependent methyltransferase